MSIFTIELNLSPEHKTRAQIDALSDPQNGDQYYDTTNSIYVCYYNGVWQVMHNHPGEA